MPTKTKPRRKATAKVKPAAKAKPTAKAKRTRRKATGGFQSWDEINAFIDRAPDNPDPRIRVWATVLWLVREQGTYTVVWNGEVAATYFGLFLEYDALRAVEASGLCSIEWGEDGDADTGRMPDVPVITILTRKPRREPKR